MTLSVNEDKKDFVRKWFIKADHDLQTAVNERTIQTDEILTDTICYHCQQTIEKYLKGFLTWHEIDYKKVHDLVYLQRLCATIDDEFLTISVTELTSYATSLRYPDDFYMPTLEETDYAIHIAKQIRYMVHKKLEFVNL